MKLGIIGTGAMGTGIAQVAATAGWEVVLMDKNAIARQNSLQGLQSILGRQIQKGKMSAEEVSAIIGKLYYTENLNQFEDCNLIIEAIVEDLSIKRSIFQQVEKIVPKGTVIASNTSSLSITELASVLEYPERFLGIHFFNPAPLMKLVEIIPAHQSSDTVISKATQWIDQWGKTTVKAKDTPGFIVNKVARPFYSEALRIMDEGLAKPQEIDTTMTELGGFRMGPFTLMDYIGHDVNYAVTESVWRAFYYHPRYSPSLTQKTLVQAGYLGRKSGRGFYSYENGNAVSGASPMPSEKWLHRILAMLINEAADTVYMGICSEKDVEIAMTQGVNYPKGLLAWGDELGYAYVVSLLDALFERYRDMRYSASPWLRDRR